jgi:dTDP-glucose pyrophosphorylase
MDKKNIQLIVPMSGIGKRFLDAGYQDPKPLIDVDGMPIIQHVVNLFPNVTDILFICNKIHQEKTDMQNILKNIFPECRIKWIPEHKKGPVYTVMTAFGDISDEKETIISYCDYGTVWNFDNFLTTVRSGDFDGGIPCYKGFHPHMLGSDNYAFCQEDRNVLLKIKEKEPFTDNKMNEYASNGTYYFKNGFIMKKYFEKLIKKDINLKGEYYISLVYNLMIEDNLRTKIFEIDKMLQWGTPYDLEVYKSWSNFFRNFEQIPKTPDTRNTTLILPMAGKGSRFSECGYTIPKPFIDVDGEAMVISATKCLPQTKNQVFIGLTEHFKDENFKDYNTIKKNYPKSNVITIEKVSDGQAATCEIGILEYKSSNDYPILISACDNGVRYNQEKYDKLLNDESVDVIVWAFRNNPTSKNNPDMYSWLDVDPETSQIKKVYTKKFVFSDPLKSYAIIGTMFFRKTSYFLNGLRRNYESKLKTNGEYYVDDVINQNIEMGLNVKVFEVENYICWGTPDDYKTYNYWEDFFANCLWHSYKK